jgi:formylglycine-generating enzyme required for sulfatase activity
MLVMVRRSAFVLSFVFLLPACGEILGVTDWVVDDGGATPADVITTGDGGKSCASPRAGGMDGVLVQNEFCIDATESTVALYDVFVNDIDTDPSSGQPPECAWNTSYHTFDPFQSDPNRAKYPITYANWCDAVAFCSYWGKHLCGNRFDGGALEVDAEAKTGQWYTACTNGTSQLYPYGNTFDASACNAGIGQDASAVEIVPTAQSCQGGVPGLYDMSGNVQEWTDQCMIGSADAGDDSCLLRGGPFFFESDSVECSSDGYGNFNARNGESPWNGIRCCWEP